MKGVVELQQWLQMWCPSEVAWGAGVHWLAAGGIVLLPPQLHSEQDHLVVVRASLVKVVQGVVLPIGLQVPSQGLLLPA